MQDVDNNADARRDKLEQLASAVLPSAVVRGRKNPLHFGLPARMKKARKVSFDAVASAAGLPDGITVYLLEQGRRIPRLDTVEKIAYALGVSPAFLAFGLEGDSSRSGELLADSVGARLRAVRESRGLTMRALARQASLTDTTVRLTESGATVPTIATVEALAKGLEISPAWLGYGLGPQVLPSRRASRAPLPSADH